VTTEVGAQGCQHEEREHRQGVLKEFFGKEPSKGIIHEAVAYGAMV
jgi:hypothetical protein